MAPMHMAHGSRVTYTVQPVSRQAPSFFAAFRTAISSA